MRITNKLRKRLRKRLRPKSYQDRLETMSNESQESQAPQLQSSSRGGAYYIWAVNEGKHYVLGGYASEAQAEAEGTRILDCYFETVWLNTTDRSEATRRLKHKYLQKTENLEEATQRAKHQT